jgi:beta-glucosidase
MMSLRGLCGGAVLLGLAITVCGASTATRTVAAAPAATRLTDVTIVGDAFHINGRPTLQGRTWRGYRVEGLLPNSRMVQATFDDLNPETRGRWAYPDTKTWDADRNTREFVAAMAEWRRRGLLAVTINLQGGSPEGYSKGQPWLNSAFTADGALRPDHAARLERVVDEADRLGMAVILGLFYFGQDQVLRDEAAVVRAVDTAVTWVLDRGYRNVLVEIDNECDGLTYDHDILKPARVPELVERVKGTTVGGRRLLVSTSFEGAKVPTSGVVRASDFVLLHGNGVSNPDRIVEFVAQARAVPGAAGKPIVFNEDDHYDFEKPWNNMVAAASVRASWGLFDFRRQGEGFDEGYQSVPVNWGVSSARKRGFFGLVAEMSGLGPAPVAAAASQALPFRNPGLPLEPRITDLLSRMTVDEKVDALGTNSAVPRLGVPSIGSTEGIHGLVRRGAPARGVPPTTTTQFPQPPGMGSTWNSDLVRRAGGVQGAEARYITQTATSGPPVLMVWGPQADLARDPRWGRIEEVYGEDPFFNGVMATAFARGIEGDDPKYWQAAPLLKHFLANSNENGRMASDSRFDERLFWEYYSVPFRMAFQDAGANAVMASYNAWNGTPMTINPVIRDVVIGKWGVQVISGDAGAVKNLWEDFKLLPDHKTAVVAALKSGLNQYLDSYKEELRAALGEGLVKEADLDEALRRKFRVASKLGLLDPPDVVPFARVRDGKAPWDGADHLAVSKQMALESIVLLKNERGALPLRKGTLRSIAVIGPRADSVHWDWYGGTPPHAITPLQGIREAAGPGVAVTYASGDDADAAVKAATASDVAIVVVGNHPTCGPNMAREWTRDGNTVPCADPGEGREGRDRETLALSQEELVRKVHAANPRTIMVLVSSFPYTITWSQEHVTAILHVAHSSQDEGWALAQALFGDYNPGGHTVVTWPASQDQLPPMLDYDIRHGRTYMYLKGAPLYPFGHGLSYTTFAFSKLRTDKASLAPDGRLVVTVDVTNTGKVAGDAVPQLYVRHLGSKVERPALKLAGFSRVHLAPGETKAVRIPLPASELAYWDTGRKAFVVEKEPVRLMLGASSADIRLRTDVRVR